MARNAVRARSSPVTHSRFSRLSPGETNLHIFAERIRKTAWSHLVHPLYNKLVTFVALALLAFGAATPARAQAETEIDYIVLLDVSGSMVGLPVDSGNPDIFGRVQESLTNFLGELDPGTTVFVAPFADGIKGFERFDIARGAADAQTYISSLRATGSSTYVYSSLLAAFERYQAFREASAAPRVGVLVVYTDGKDNSPGDRTMGDVVREFGLARQENDFLYYSTLGVELTAEERSALDESGFALYNPNERGEVRPLRVVEPRYPLLDFGNLLVAPDTQRELRFDVRSRGGLPDGTLLGARASFPGVEEVGGAVEVEGGPFDPSSGASGLALRLVNVDPATLPQGAYDGTIRFEPTEPGVLALPVRARFRFQPSRTVALAGSGDRLDFGEVDPFGVRADAGSEVAVPLAFNADALSEGGAFTVRIEPDEGRPLPARTFLVNGESGLSHRVEVDGGREVSVVVRPPEDTAPGEYGGALYVESGDEVEADGPQAVEWRVEVLAPPRTAGEWAALVAGALLALALLVFVGAGLATGVWPFWKRPSLRGHLHVIKGNAGVREFPLRGERFFSVGVGTGHLSDASGRLTMRAEYERKGLVAHTVAKAVSEEGTVLRKRPGERRPAAFGAEPLHDQDQFEIAPYTLEYSEY